MTPKGKKPAASSNGLGSGATLADRYRLEERVAAGGMGEVWRATDTLLQRVVAVKLLRESLAEDPIVSERFRREALTAAQLSHPNMAGVYDYVQQDGRPGIVMEFVDGETLAERLAREKQLSTAESVRIASGLLAALRSAHDAGIVHRDVKPGNVMLTHSGDIKVTDFGIARAASDHTLTETGMVIGTAHYLSPEQVGGNPATPSSDLYSVGAILYEMLAGAKPFQAETPIAAAMMRLSGDPPDLVTLAPGTPESVVRVVARALAREPGDRYGSAEEMRFALERAFTSSQPPTAPQRIDPTPTEVLPVGSTTPTDVAAAAPTAAVRPPVEDRTGKGHPAVVAARRRREYRRLALYAALIAVGAGLITLLVLALVGNGTKIVKVPRLTGRSYTEAAAQAKTLGLKVNPPLDHSSTLPAGTVIGQDIKPGAQVAEGETITLTVSNGIAPGVPVPDVVGEDLETAQADLQRAGFHVTVSTLETNSAREGTVVDQNPTGNTPAQQGSGVAIVVAAAPRHHGKGKGGGG